MNLNKIILVGRLTSNIQVTYTKTNIAYSRFTLAISRKYNSQNGEPITDYIPVVAWRQSAINLEKLVCKGSPLLVEGSLQSNRYQNNEGNLVTSFDVQLDNFEILETKEQFQRRQQQINGENYNSSKPSFANSQNIQESSHSTTTTEPEEESNSTDDDLLSGWDLDNI